VTTRGFGDVLKIGDQRRPELFGRAVIKPAPVTGVVEEIAARLTPDGGALIELDDDDVRAALERLRERGVRTVAVTLMHAWADDRQERRVATLAREMGFSAVVTSAALTPRLGLLRRAENAALEAALVPRVRAYLEEVSRDLGGLSFDVLTSAGGLVRDADVSPVDMLLSGPAGGVVGAAAAGAAAGFERVLSFDMGGTSTDVARIAGVPDVVSSHAVGGHTIARPAVAIETVAAGGGSVCSVERGRVRVGPQSAGAEPGPACYGAGGPLTITDVNLLLGRLTPERFAIPVSVSAAEAACAQVVDEAAAQTGEAVDRDALLEGFLRIANQRMAEAMRRVSVRRGFDAREHALVAFGGAGPQHACDVAELLGVTRVVIPADASLLSAVGLHHARSEHVEEASVLRALAEVNDELAVRVGAMEQAARGRLREAHGVEDVAVDATLAVRMVGQESTVDVAWREGVDVQRAFAERYRAMHADEPARELELVSVRVVARAADEEEALPMDVGVASEQGGGSRRVRVGGAWIEAPLVARSAVTSGAQVAGPALIVEERTTTWLREGWSAAAHEGGSLVLTKAASQTKAGVEVEESGDALVGRELLVNRMSAIAEQMGDALERAAVSTNVKERRDFSCAVVDADGRLVSAAPHIPVHLGAMGACVRAVVAHLGELEKGEAAITNHPAFGGSHLPDVTIVQPAHDEAGVLIGYVASRAHHAEIGGLTPGSMPPNARSLAEEGVPIAPLKLVEGGAARFDRLEALLTEHAHPTRALRDNLADVRAALAAGRRAVEALRACARETSTAAVHDAMGWIVGHAERVVREKTAGLGLPAGALEQVMDDGARIVVRLSRGEEGRLRIDFSGTSAQREGEGGNTNAPLAVVRSAVAYVLRVLMDEPLPLNDGLLNAVELVVPEGTMLNPVFDPADDERSPAVAAGNVETSQQVVEALVRALGLVAGGPGTMNNLLLGNDRFSVYETIGAGAGATAERDGADAVHCHMTNTAITDAEVLERRCPLRVERFAVRRGSGGSGTRRGGDGIVRAIRVLEQATCTVIAQRRARGAPGMAGGGDGTPGAQRVVRRNGTVETLAHTTTVTLESGDVIDLETPGGGAWGPPGGSV
jgi:5-oxoprolinase (ATP-hydrolysing)